MAQKSTSSFYFILKIYIMALPWMHSFETPTVEIGALLLLKLKKII